MRLRSNEPFWLVKDGLLHTYPSLRHDIDCDVLIVGSGITGALVAHACVEVGFDTVLIDKREIAHGSTSATTSMLQYEIDVPLHQLIPQVGQFGAEGAFKGCREAIDRIERLVKTVGHSCGFERKMSLYFANDDDGIAMLKQELQTRKDTGFAVEWVDETFVRETYGLDALGGILSQDGASVDAFELAHRLLHWNEKRGLRVFDRTELASSESHGTGLHIQTDTGCRIHAHHLVFCTGYESQAMIPEKIVTLKSTYACVSETDVPLKDAAFDTLFWNTDDPYLYFRTTDDRRLLIGGGDNRFKNPSQRDGHLDKAETMLVEAAERLFPSLTFISDFRWAGTFGETTDGLPYIGPHPDMHQTYFVLGFGGNGILFSVMGMDILVAALRGEEHPMAHYFRFGR